MWLFCLGYAMNFHFTTPSFEACRDCKKQACVVLVRLGVVLECKRVQQMSAVLPLK
jgi:hypothetical protein